VTGDAPLTAPATGRRLLEAHGLVLAYDGRPVLSGVTFAVHEGEFWFLLGRNGSGKTTLLHAIVGMVPARAGRLWLAPEIASRERLGFVPQHCELRRALPMTVREFVLLGTVNSRSGRRDDAERLEWALAHVGLAGMSRRDYWSLSGGERQRALVARALVRRPSFLALDEPTANLDPGSEHGLVHLLADLNRAERLTLLVVTHDLAMAARHASHLALATEGRLVVGAREEILAPGTLARVFGVEVQVAPCP